jgi:hypothetical protein
MPVRFSADHRFLYSWRDGRTVLPFLEDFGTAAGIYSDRDRATPESGHRIRYWDDAAFREFFDGAFTLLTVAPAVEQESASNQVPCSLTLMAGRKQ